MDDTYQASGYAGLNISNKTLPIVYGTTYVDLVPLAIANILTRVKMTNDYGVVSFRCSDVFNRPRLPLPKLQDLGIPAQDIINIIGVDPTDPEDPTNTIEFEGVPLTTDDTELGWLLNCLNLLIGYSTAVSNAVSKGSEIKGIILNMLDYYALPDKSLEMLAEADRTISIYGKYQEYLNKCLNSSDTTLVEIKTAESDFSSASYAKLLIMRDIIQNDIVDPLSVITPDTDFGYFDYTITDAVVQTILGLEKDVNPYTLAFSMQAKSLAAAYGNPPVYPSEPYNSLLLTYSGNFRNLISEALTLLANAYSSVTDNLKAVLEGDYAALEILKTQESVYYDMLLSYADDKELVEQMKKTVDAFSFTYSNGNIIDHLEDKAELDKYFAEVGDAAKIELYNMISIQQGSSDINLTEVNLGGNFKDSGNFYYADLAYAVGYTKLSKIHSIQIDDEYYKLTGETTISESGCTKYTFTRQVLPTYTVDVEMYIYPGTPNQGYCPTINKYHNYQTSKYYGMFTKLDDEGLMGVYVYKGYRPMQATVEEVIKIGKMDLNSINLNDPSLDKQSYEAMLMTEIKNLTNASSLNEAPITTDDFKYYLSSKMVDFTAASNYPGLAIIEFKRFPIGASPSFPKIKVKVTGEDLIL